MASCISVLKSAHHSILSRSRRLVGEIRILLYNNRNAPLVASGIKRSCCWLWQSAESSITESIDNTFSGSRIDCPHFFFQCTMSESCQNRGRKAKVFIICTGQIGLLVQPLLFNPVILFLNLYFPATSLAPIAASADGIVNTWIFSVLLCVDYWLLAGVFFIVSSFSSWFYFFSTSD